MRGANPYLTTGTGSGQPTGCLHGIMAALTANGSADTDGIGGANTIGWNDVVQFEQALDPLYRLNARFMLRPSTLSWLRSVKDKNLRPVFEGLNAPEPHLLGYPLKLNVAMDQLQTQASSPAVTRVSPAFGDFSYFKIRRSWPIVQRKAEQWAIYGQVGFSLLWRMDSRLIRWWRRSCSNVADSFLKGLPGAIQARASCFITANRAAIRFSSVAA